jgi:peptidoglycan L-alanyl-D-glutamate endopeptidase CwlK
MPKFSQQSFSILATCHIELQTLFYEVIKNFDCKIIEGYRNQADQDQAFYSGESTLKWPNGKHNCQPSIAVDVAPYPIDWKNTKRFYYFGGIVIGIAQRLRDEGKMIHRIRWGGDWNGDSNLDDQKLVDLVHYELII